MTFREACKPRDDAQRSGIDALKPWWWSEGTERGAVGFGTELRTASREGRQILFVSHKEVSRCKPPETVAFASIAIEMIQLSCN